MALKAIEVFQTTHERATTLLRQHSTGKAGRPKKEKEDILRAAVMLIVAGVDSYFHDKILECLTPFLKTRKGKNVPGNLVKILESKGGVGRLLPILYEERPHRHIHTIVKKAHADLTFQKPDKITNALKLISVSDFWFKVARRMGRGASKKSVRERLGRYAARRDKIVHEGDRTRGGKTNPISRPYVRDCLSFINRFITAADSVIDRATGA